MRFLYVPFLAFLLAASAVAQPPTVIPKGGYADLTVPVPKGASLIWDITPTPVQESSGLPDGRLIFSGSPGTTYTALAFMVDFDNKKFTKTRYVFQFSGTPVTPPPTDPKDPPTDPKDPPVTPVLTTFFIVVREDGPAAPSFTKTMSDPAWDALRAKGYLVKDYTASEAIAKLGLPRPANLPVVITLQQPAKNPEKSKVVRAAIPLPTTSEGIAKLPEGL